MATTTHPTAVTESACRQKAAAPPPPWEGKRGEEAGGAEDVEV